MSITDELREYLLCHPPAHYADFSAFVDRIDAERVDDVAKAYDEGRNGMKATLERDYVKLPTDADGVPIHPGDVMEWINDKNVIRTVSGVGAGVFFAWVKDTERYSQCEASAYRHRHEPTVESLLREFGDWYTHMKGSCDEYGFVFEYAEKLREVVEHERERLSQER